VDKALEHIKCILWGEITWVAVHHILQANLMEQKRQLFSNNALTNESEH